MWYTLAGVAVDLPTIRLGDAEPPRVPWTLFTNVPVNGNRGVLAREDAGCFGMTTRVRYPSHKAVVPRFDERTGEPIVYRMEPDANWVSGTERRLPHAPHIPFDLPSGQLIVEILKPDGSVDQLGPAPVAQSLIRTPTTPGGSDIDEATGHIGDVYQLYNGDVFAYSFDQYGDHVIYLYGEIVDIYGSPYAISKTYDVTVARVLDIGSRTAADDALRGR